MYYIMVMLFAILLNICSLSSVVPKGENSRLKHLVRKRQIVGGSDAKIENFPYLARVEVITKKSIGNCVGTIISSNFLVTTAHCMKSTDVLASRTVYVGSSERYKGANCHLVQSFRVHPNFDIDAWPPHDDLAIIKLEEPIKLDGVTKKAIDMAESGESTPDGTDATVVGWGRLSDDEDDFSSKLLSLDMKIVGKEKCIKAWSKGPMRKLFKFWSAIFYRSLGRNLGRFICAKPSVNNELCSTCDGDSGGPLVVGNKLVGVASLGRIEGSTKRLSVFTEISSYRKWMVDTVVELF